jgi:TonB-dependent starch-binding outer membrane protein SusC
MNKRQLKACLMLLPCLLFFGSAGLAQRQITGNVSDIDNGDPLIGASVAVVGTPTGAITDIDGNFRLSLPEGAKSLKVTYTGYAEQIINIGNSNTINVYMSAGVALNETVVIGYGTVKREDATGLVQTVNSESFNRGAITGPQELLSGKIAGVVITNDGGPGSGAKIRIRGEASLSASNNPLIVVDGIPLDNGGVSGSRNQLNIVNPNDIESITVLKDASAAAIYGNRASGGVILITTKKGKLGKKIQVGYNANVSVGQNANQVDVLSADEFRAAVNAHYANPDPMAPAHPALALLGTANTDWQNEIYQSAWGQDHSVSLSGGVAMVPYRVSLGYTNKDGVLKSDNFNRYSAAVNLNPGFLNNTLQVNVHFKGMLSDNHFADRGAIGNALSFDPTRTVRDTSTRYGGFTTWKIANGNPNGLAPTNPVALLELRDDNSTVKQYITNAAVDYRMPFLPALRANLSVGYDYSKGSGTVVVPNFAAFAFDALNGGGVNNTYEQTKKNSVLESYLNYKKGFGDHELDVMGGYSWQHFEVGSSFRNSDSAGTPAETTIGTDPAEFYLVSLFGRLNYAYKSRYLFTGSLRRDGTSRFAPQYRWGLFPAAALAVKLVENDNKYLGNLKLRTSWGVTGQQDIGDYYAYLARYQFGNPNAQYQFGDEFVTTIRPNGYVGDIKWEETTTYNAGLDFSIIKNRLSGTLDVYQRNTKDLLNFIPFSALSNLTNFGTDNIGTMETKGVELSLNFTPVKTKNINWEVSTNFAYNTSTITKLTTSDDPTYKGVFTGGIAGGVGSNIQIHSVGYFPSSFYVFEQKYDESGKLLEGQFVDRNRDSIINDDDKYRYKNPAPLYTLGITSNLSIGSFSLSFAGRANFGNYVYNNVQTDMGYLNRLYHTTKYLSNVNQSAVDLQVLDQAKLTFSDHFVTNAAFFRFDHITASYNFDKLIGKYLNVYLTVQNPLVVTRYKGLDPELGNGIDNNVYPRPRTYVLGLNVNF